MNKLLNSVTFPAYKSSRHMARAGAKKKHPALSGPSFGPPVVHRAKFINGIRVAAGNPMGGSLAACTIMFHVGSRHEFDDTLGVTHFLRASSVCSGLGHTAFVRARYLQHMAGYITISSDRQTIAYTMQCPEPDFSDLRTFLVDIATRCQYYDYDLDEVRKLIRYDLERRSREEHCLDLVQKACFTGPLEHSIYCEKGRIDRINSDIINSFVGDFFQTPICSIGSSSLPYQETMKVASEVACHLRNKMHEYVMPMSCPRAGFEYYDTGPYGDTYIALGVPGSGTCDFLCCVKHAILAASLGLGNSRQGGHVWDRSPQQPLGTITEFTTDVLTDYKAFNISYLDNGCFGIIIKTRSKMAECASFSAAQFFANICNITDEEILIGKKRLKLGVIQNDANCIHSSEGLALQAAIGVNCDNAEALGNLIDSVALEDVKMVAKIIANKRCCGQLAVAVVGDVGCVPNDQELRSYF